MSDRKKVIAATEWLEELLAAGSGDDRRQFFSALHALIGLAKDDVLPEVEVAVEGWRNRGY